MKTRLPRPLLLCPFPSSISPHRDEIDAKNLAWLDAFALVASPEARRRARRARFGSLAARAYPTASVDVLCIAAAWASWLCVRDDACDEAGIGADPIAMRAQAEELLGALTCSRAAHARDPLYRALADLRGRILDKGGAACLARFTSSVQDYFDGCIWEAENRQRRVPPDIEAYQSMRAVTIYVRPFFDINELAADAPLPVEARHDPTLSRMIQAATRVICYANDIVSAENALRNDDFHNIVILLHRTRGMSLEDAVYQAVGMHDLEIETFRALEKELLRRHSQHPEVERFVTALKCWMRASLDWSLETGRYAFESSAEHRRQCAVPQSSQRVGTC